MKFQAGLCAMRNGTLTAPCTGATIESDSVADAIQKAKKWTATVDIIDGSWLQILVDGKSVASFKPGEF